VLQITLLGVPGGGLVAEAGITSTLNYTDATQNFNYEYGDVYGTVTRGCLLVTTLTAGRETYWNQSCSAAAAGDVLVKAPIINGTTYVAYGFVEYGGFTHYLKQMTKSFIQRMSLGSMGPFLVAMLIAVFGFVGIWSAQASAVLIGITPFIASMAGILKVSPAVTIPVMVVGIVLAFVLSKGDRQ
jgi:hypothetical protein